MIPRLIWKWKNLEHLDLSGVVWQNYNASFSLPQDWSQDWRCKFDFGEDNCREFPLSWKDAPSSLKTVHFSNMRKCGAVCDNRDLDINFDFQDYNEVFSIAIFSGAGFNCTASSALNFF